MHFAANDIFSFCFRIFCFLLFSFFNHHFYYCSPSIGGASFNPLDDSQQQQRKDIRQRLECDVHFLLLLSSVWRRFVSHFRERERERERGESAIGLNNAITTTTTTQHGSIRRQCKSVFVLLNCFCCCNYTNYHTYSEYHLRK